MKKRSFMWKAFLVQVLLFVILGNIPAYAAGLAGYIRGASSPWGQTTNEATMTTVFGTVGVDWQDLRMADGAGPFMSNSGYDVIFLEGSDGTALELTNYLNTNLPTIEKWVQSGGRLFLNSAPNQGGHINFAFGGVTLSYDGGNTLTRTGTVTDPSHPIFLGPNLPVGTTFTANWFAHAILSGGGTVPLMHDQLDASKVLLTELQYGEGVVLFGGMTTTNFHSPDPEASNLRANILAYLSESGLSEQGLPFPLQHLINTSGIISAPGALNIPRSDDSRYKISWGASRTSGATYVLEEATNRSFTRNKRTAYSGAETSVRIKYRRSGTTYYYRVKSINSYGTESEWVVGRNSTKVRDVLHAPSLNASVANKIVSLAWDTASGAEGYRLYYAPYPYVGEHTIQSIEMGGKTEVQYTLPVGTAYYVAVKSYASSKESGFSNIELVTAE